MKWLVGFLLILLTSPSFAQIPSAANQYKRELTRVVQQEYGLQGNVALHAAQIHQESAWRADATSWVGAQGLSQFMPTTAEWIVEVYPDLGKAAPYTPSWAFRAQARYNKWLYNRVKGNTECDKWWFTLRSYNGGLGHIQAESRNAVDPLDRHSVDEQCGTARRSVTHCKENLGYPDRIINLLEPRYLQAAWLGSPTCPIEPVPPPPVPEPIFMDEPELFPEPEPEPLSFWGWLKQFFINRSITITE